MTSMERAVVLASIIAASCGGRGVLVSRGTTVPLELQRMSGDDLHEYFKARGRKGWKDGSKLEVSVVMVDLAYLKATGQTLEAGEEEMQALSTLKRFEVLIEYTTPNVFPGESEVDGIAFDKWKVSLVDSTGTDLAPSSVSFDPPLVQKAATEPEAMLEKEDVSKLVMTYILKGNLIFDYQVPEGCRWIDILFEPPLTGHRAAARWNVLN